MPSIAPHTFRARRAAVDLRVRWTHGGDRRGRSAHRAPRTARGPGRARRTRPRTPRPPRPACAPSALALRLAGLVPASPGPPHPPRPQHALPAAPSPLRPPAAPNPSPHPSPSPLPPRAPPHRRVRYSALPSTLLPLLARNRTSRILVSDIATMTSVAIIHTAVKSSRRCDGQSSTRRRALRASAATSSTTTAMTMRSKCRRSSGATLARAGGPLGGEDDGEGTGEPWRLARCGARLAATRRPHAVRAPPSF